jgi:hypothetical protein
MVELDPSRRWSAEVRAGEEVSHGGCQLLRNRHYTHDSLSSSGFEVIVIGRLSK